MVHHQEQLKNIIVVGGGYAGIRLCKNLMSMLKRNKLDDYRVLLVERKSHLYHLIASPRAAVEEGLDDSLLIPYDGIFKNQTKHQFVQAIATGFDQQFLFLDPSSAVFEKQAAKFEKSVPYAYLILATGIQYRVPFQLASNEYDDCQQELRSVRQQITQANDIVIAGGGLTGIEVAGELADHYTRPNRLINKNKGKTVTLVHTHDELANGAFPAATCTKLLAKVQAAGVRVIVNDAIPLPPTTCSDDYPSALIHPDGGFVTTQGAQTKLPCDLLIVSVAGRPCTDWIFHGRDEDNENGNLPKSILTAKGYVKVRSTLQLDVSSSSSSSSTWQCVFAMGDMTDFPFKLAHKAFTHADVISKNILEMIQERQPSHHYTESETTRCLVSFGKTQGAGYLPGICTVGDWVSSILHSKHLAINGAWQYCGLPKPSQPGTKERFSWWKTIIIGTMIIAALMYTTKIVELRWPVFFATKLGLSQ